MPKPLTFRTDGTSLRVTSIVDVTLSAVTAYTDAAATTTPVTYPYAISNGSVVYFPDTLGRKSVTVSTSTARGVFVQTDRVIPNVRETGAEILVILSPAVRVADDEAAFAAGGGVGSGAASLTDRGAWATGTAYAVGDVVTQTGQRYVCHTAHTSGTFATDLAAADWVSLDPGKALLSSNNLSDVAVAATARTNLGAASAASVTALSASSVGAAPITAAAASAVAALPLAGITPATLSGCVGSYTADALVAAGGTDGSGVASWTDASSAANHLVQATSGNQPTLKTAVVNGHAVIRCASPRYLALTYGAALGTSWSIVIAVRFPTANNSFAVGGSNSVYGAASGCVVKVAAGSYTATSIPAGWAVYVLNSASGTASFWRNGVLMATGVSAASMAKIAVGANDVSSPAFYADCDIEEIHVYNRVLTVDEIGAMTRLIAPKVGAGIGFGVTARARTDSTIGGRPCSVVIPESLVLGKAAPLVLFSHGQAGSNFDPVQNQYLTAMTDVYLSLGYIVAASDEESGTGLTAAWGNSAGLADGAALANSLNSLYGISKILVVGNSAGGPGALLHMTGVAGAGTDLPAPVTGFLGIYAATNLGLCAGGSGLAVYAAYGINGGALSSSASIGATSVVSTVSFAAGTPLRIDQGASSAAGEIVIVGAGGPTGSGPYTIPLASALTKAHSGGALIDDYANHGTAGHDPLLISASAYAGKRFRMYASASDTTVPKTSNSDALNTLVASVAAESTVVACTGAHGDPSHFQPLDVAGFALRCML